MGDDRSEMEATRLAGLEQRHEQRLARAMYTAAEVKVLTEAALRLGRKEAGEEIADALQELDREIHQYNDFAGGVAAATALARAYAKGDA